jgi:hypothetical protein
MDIDQWVQNNIMVLPWFVLPAVREVPTSMTVPEFVWFRDGPSPSTSMVRPTSVSVGTGVVIAASASSFVSLIPIDSVVVVLVTAVGGPVVIVNGSSCSEDEAVVVGAFVKVTRPSSSVSVDVGTLLSLLEGLILCNKVGANVATGAQEGDDVSIGGRVDVVSVVISWDGEMIGDAVPNDATGLLGDVTFPSKGSS